jgi:hypothetical protein
MTTYRVYLRTDIEWARQNFEAPTPEEALAFARQHAKERFDELDFEDYQSPDHPINQIEVCDAEGHELIVWQDDELRLRLAARDLLDAAEKVVARWERGDLAAAVRELGAAIAKAKEGAG